VVNNRSTTYIVPGLPLIDNETGGIKWYCTNDMGARAKGKYRQ